MPDGEGPCREGNPPGRGGRAGEATPLFSVIVPVRSGAGGLRACLHSLNNQTTARDLYEVVVVDDGSTDDSAKVAEEMGAVVIERSPRGPASARNAGVRAARGEFILFTDADCIPAPDWIDGMTQPLIRDPSVAGVKGCYGTRQKSLVARFVQLEFEERYRLLSRFSSIDMVDTHSAAFRKETFLEAGGFDTTFSRADNEDTELSYRLAGSGHRLVFNPGARVYHHHPEALLDYLLKKARRGYWRFLAYARHPDRMLRDTYTPQLLKLRVIIAPILLLTLIAGPLSPPFFLIALILSILFILASLPFIRVARDSGQGPGFLLLILPLLYLEALFVSSGSLAGLLHRFIPEMMKGRFWKRRSGRMEGRGE